MNIKPLGDRVIIEPAAAEEKTATPFFTVNFQELKLA